MKLFTNDRLTNKWEVGKNGRGLSALMRGLGLETKIVAITLRNDTEAAVLNRSSGASAKVGTKRPKKQ